MNLSGGSWFWRDEYARIPRKAFIDSDPAFTQLAIAKAEPWYVEFFQRFDHLFTFGANIGTPASPMPVGGFTWHKTWQPVTLDDWQTDRAAGRPLHDRDDLADRELHRRRRQQGPGVREVTSICRRGPRSRFELAINGPQTLLREHGWATVDAMSVSRTPWDYRDFIQRSKAEFGVAKHTYVATRSGWFSDRTECYLAVGPPGAGAGHRMDARTCRRARACSRSRSPDEALAGIDAINGDYAAARAAAPPRSRASTSTPAACCRRLLDDGVLDERIRIAHVGAGRDDDSAAASRARSRR